MHFVCKVALLSGLMVAFGGLSKSEVVVVANSCLRATRVQAEELREVFNGGRSSLPDGSKVTPVLLKSGPVHESFLKAYIGKSAGAFEASWRKLLFTGRAGLPKVFDSETALLDYVAKTPGAIGYASDAGEHPGIKVLTVQ
jgi:hypothetical protein